jgi:ABC-type polar amino acid transport system ATPase subunit
VKSSWLQKRSWEGTMMVGFTHVMRFAKDVGDLVVFMDAGVHCADRQAGNDVYTTCPSLDAGILA